jgi:hypothetical protein
VADIAELRKTAALHKAHKALELLARARQWHAEGRPQNSVEHCFELARKQAPGPELEARVAALRVGLYGEESDG